MRLTDPRMCRRRPRAAGTLAIGAALLGGCGGDRAADEGRSPAADPTPVPVLVTPLWLVEHAADRDLLVLDTRPRAEFEAGHPRGAVHLPPEALVDPANGRDLAPLSSIEATLSAAGVDASRRVVVADGGDFRAAARVFWVLEVHGHDRASVLDGGVPAFAAAGGELSSTPAPTRPSRFVAAMRPERLATTLSVMRAVTRKDASLLDARSHEEFDGTVSEAKRHGHIPGAVNVSHERNLAVSKEGACSFAEFEALLDVYRHLPPDRKVITYCNSGNRASVSYLALRALGRDVAVYDGSWLEWGNDESLPVERAAPADAR